MVLCYGEEKEHWYGSELFHGFRATSPREGERLPLAYRAFKGWERFSVVGEGAPIPEEAAC